MGSMFPLVGFESSGGSLSPESSRAYLRVPGYEVVAGGAAFLPLRHSPEQPVLDGKKRLLERGNLLFRLCTPVGIPLVLTPPCGVSFLSAMYSPPPSTPAIGVGWR